MNIEDKLLRDIGESSNFYNKVKIKIQSSGSQQEQQAKYLQVRFFQLINSRSKVIMSAKEKQTIWSFLRFESNVKLLRTTDHKNIWLKCSGAYNKMLMHPGYYDSLKFSPLKYPHPAITDIEKDLCRSGAS